MSIRQDTASATVAALPREDTTSTGPQVYWASWQEGNETRRLIIFTWPTGESARMEHFLFEPLCSMQRNGDSVRFSSMEFYQPLDFAGVRTESGWTGTVTGRRSDNNGRQFAVAFERHPLDPAMADSEPLGQFSLTWVAGGDDILGDVLLVLRSRTRVFAMHGEYGGEMVGDVYPTANVRRQADTVFVDSVGAFRVDIHGETQKADTEEFTVLGRTSDNAASGFLTPPQMNCASTPRR